MSLDDGLDNFRESMAELEADQEALAMAARLGYPPALAKACCDPFNYAVGLKNGEVYVFEYAEVIDSAWVRLKGLTPPQGCTPEWYQHAGRYYLRGLEVRVDAIAWVNDGPGDEDK